MARMIVLSLAVCVSAVVMAQSAPTGLENDVLPLPPEEISAAAAADLVQHDGAHVSVRLNDTWHKGMSPQDVRNFVDHADYIYEILKEMVGREPAGAGRLPITIVPLEDGCGGWACGALGAKGVVIKDFEGGNTDLWRAARQDVVHNVLVHEISHNFDVWSGYLRYHQDSAHYWTDLANVYWYTYTRLGARDIGFVPVNDRSPDELLADWRETTLGSYLRVPGRSWARCVKDSACGGVSAKYARAGLALAIIESSAPGAWHRFGDFINSWEASHAPPSTEEAKEDFHIEALSAAANANLSCVETAVAWSVSGSLQRRLRSTYGAESPLCLDADGDDQAPITGDCNDANAGVFAGALETPNGLDDDCNGIVDDVAQTVRGATQFENWQVTAPLLPFPFRLDAETNMGFDYFWRFTPPGASRVRVQTCSPQQGADAWVVIFSPRGEHLEAAKDDRGVCSTFYQQIGQASRPYYYNLRGISMGGPATAVVRLAAETWPLPAWATIEAARRGDDSYRITVRTQGTRPANADRIRLWVTGFGFVDSAAYDDVTTFDWTPPRAIAEGSMVGFRVQAYAGRSPAAPITSAAWLTAGQIRRRAAGR